MSNMKIVKQQDLLDCGICSLASIINYYGGYVPVEKLRLDTNTTKNGTTAYNLLFAATKYGFDCKGFKVNSLEDSNIILPAIAHLEYKNGLKHFVVIYEITKQKVILMDPAKGKVVMKKDEFLKIFTKVLLVFYPREKITILKKGKSINQVFLDILKKEKNLFIQIIFISIFLTIFTIISSYYFKVGIDAITSNSYIDYIKIIVLMFLLITLLKTIFTYIRMYLENHLNKNIDVSLLSDFINHIFKIPSVNLSSRNSGEIVTRVNELSNLKTMFTSLFVDFLLDFLLMLFSIPILISINNKLFLILFLMMVIYFIIGMVTTKLIYNKAYQNISYEEEFNTNLIENITARESIKNLNITSFILEKIETNLSKFLYDNYLLTSFLNKEGNLKNFVNEVGFFIVNTYGMYAIFHNDLSITSLITFNSLMMFFLDPIKNLINSLPKYNFLKATYAKLSEFIDIEEEDLKELQILSNNSIKVTNLTFSYNNYLPIIKNKSFFIKSNSLVLLKGKSGCGKSTLCRILNKDLSLYEGNIYLGDVNLLDCTLNTIKSNILYVSQNEVLFNDTIYNNLALDKDASIEEINKASSISLLDEVINKKKLRYDTLISNDSLNISGGERQRIVLTRSLLKNFKILILDESLSEVDYVTERKIILNIKNNFKDKTIIYITHKKHDDLFDNIIYFEEESYE
ncbi:MAG: peptidase domain-containing ABC transporter [Bacilli bacterium]